MGDVFRAGWAVRRAGVLFLWLWGAAHSIALPAWAQIDARSLADIDRLIYVPVADEAFRIHQNGNRALVSPFRFTPVQNPAWPAPAWTPDLFTAYLDWRNEFERPWSLFLAEADQSLPAKQLHSARLAIGTFLGRLPIPDDPLKAGRWQTFEGAFNVLLQEQARLDRQRIRTRRRQEFPAVPLRSGFEAADWIGFEDDWLIFLTNWIKSHFSEQAAVSSAFAEIFAYYTNPSYVAGSLPTEWEALFEKGLSKADGRPEDGVFCNAVIHTIRQRIDCINAMGRSLNAPGFGRTIIGHDGRWFLYALHHAGRPWPKSIRAEQPRIR